MGERGEEKGKRKGEEEEAEREAEGEEGEGKGGRGSEKEEGGGGAKAHGGGAGEVRQPGLQETARQQDVRTSELSVLLLGMRQTPPEDIASRSCHEAPIMMIANFDQVIIIALRSSRTVQ